MTATSNAPATASSFPEGFSTTWWISNWIFGVWSIYMVESILRRLRMFVDVTHILYSSFPYYLRRLKRSYEFPCLLRQSSLHPSVPWSVSCQKVLAHRPKSLHWRNEEACLRKALPPSSSSDSWGALARIWGGFRECRSSRCLNSWWLFSSARAEVTKARIYSHGCIARPSARPSVLSSQYDFYRDRLRPFSEHLLSRWPYIPSASPPGNRASELINQAWCR